ncbi:hypothetical protein [Candidatus Rhabdochlamydia sp. T3358]|uniref:hypothetical protein n=1 Tax=Candidatus Rhabdochlamydia sp. T3358 TaxID=2099795 RepID=UPI0010B6440D|nr:hypothetical protein [Candidatus Rhabdochlamydia sp. T3358]VHN99629.1 hypothetical protein RHT_00081 [Candidatus Rhabdochlamydia sp. T3358]
MASIIPKNAPFLYPSSESKEIASFNSTNTDKKISAIANDTLEKSSTKWYVKLPLAQNRKPSVNATCLSLMPELSEIGKQEKAFNMTLLDVAGAKEALKTPKKKIPPKPLPRSNKTCLSPRPEPSIVVNAENTPSPPSQENKPEFKFVSSETVPTLLKSSFQMKGTNLQEATKDLGTNSSFSNTEENIESKEAIPQEKLDDWAGVDQILSECFEFLKDKPS